jgi:Flp pilus assembly protein TadD
MDYDRAMIRPTIPHLVLSFALLAAPAPAAEPVAALIAQAHEAQTQGNLELALRLAQSAIVADPARPASYVALGDIYAVAGQRDYARTYYNEALSIDPENPAALYGVAALDVKAPNVTPTP